MTFCEFLFHSAAHFVGAGATWLVIERRRGVKGFAVGTVAILGGLITTFGLAIFALGHQMTVWGGA